MKCRLQLKNGSKKAKSRFQWAFTVLANVSGIAHTHTHILTQRRNMIEQICQYERMSDCIIDRYGRFCQSRTHGCIVWHSITTTHKLVNECCSLPAVNYYYSFYQRKISVNLVECEYECHRINRWFGLPWRAGTMAANEQVFPKQSRRSSSLAGTEQTASC